MYRCQVLYILSLCILMYVALRKYPTGTFNSSETEQKGTIYTTTHSLTLPTCTYLYVHMYVCTPFSVRNMTKTFPRLLRNDVYVRSRHVSMYEVSTEYACNARTRKEGRTCMNALDRPEKRKRNNVEEAESKPAALSMLWESPSCTRPKRGG